MEIRPDDKLPMISDQKMKRRGSFSSGPIIHHRPVAIPSEPIIVKESPPKKKVTCVSSVSPTPQLSMVTRIKPLRNSLSPILKPMILADSSVPSSSEDLTTAVLSVRVLKPISQVSTTALKGNCLQENPKESPSTAEEKTGDEAGMVNVEPEVVECNLSSEVAVSSPASIRAPSPLYYKAIEQSSPKPSRSPSPESCTNPQVCGSYETNVWSKAHCNLICCIILLYKPYYIIYIVVVYINHLCNTHVAKSNMSNNNSVCSPFCCDRVWPAQQPWGRPGANLCHPVVFGWQEQHSSPYPLIPHSQSLKTTFTPTAASRPHQSRTKANLRPKSSKSVEFCWWLFRYEHQCDTGHVSLTDSCLCCSSKEK